jgi:hypothetical protein
MMTKNLGPRARKLAEVAQGRLSREKAEEWARQQGLRPFSFKPDIPAADVMALDYWTTPMAAAWFIWRSPDAVRDQWDRGRQGWTIWERIPALRRPNSIGLWHLKRVGPATLAEVFSQAGLAKEAARSPTLPRSTALGVNSMTDNPYDRMRLVLECGWLQGSYSVADQEEEEKVIQPDRWRSLLRQMTNSQRHPVSSAEASNDAAPSGSGDDEIIFRRTQVIEAEARISGEEFMWRIWTISQILGWLAYGSEPNFRSLSEADLKGRTYLGLRYDQDFYAGNLEARFIDMFIHAGIKPIGGEGEEAINVLSGIDSIWDISDVEFVRDDVLAISAGNVVEKATDLHSDNTKSKQVPSASVRGRGRPAKVTPVVVEAMIEKVKSNIWTRDQLKKFTSKYLAHEFSCSRDIIDKARPKALESLPENAGNSNTDN